MSGFRLRHTAPVGSTDALTRNSGGCVSVDQQQPRILVIEYDPWRRTAIVDRLSGAGYQVGLASNGFSGLRLVRHAAPDVIVLDGQLPDVSVADLCEQLCDHPATRAAMLASMPIDGGEPSRSIAAEVHTLLERAPL